jgi:phospholipase C
MAPTPSGSVWWNPFNWVPHDANGLGGQIISNPSNFINDIGNPSTPYDAAVTWITPTADNSDHAGLTKNTSPNWVAAVVNAIGTSKYWDSSVIFLTWDDWGGWYDHVSPPYKDYDGLGIRVPFIIISPYTKQGLVTHRLYEQASILKYIENRFGLATLSAADVRAADPEPDVMSNSGATPRPFVKIVSGSYDKSNTPGAPDDQ